VIDGFEQQIKSELEKELLFRRAEKISFQIQENGGAVRACRRSVGGKTTEGKGNSIISGRESQGPLGNDALGVQERWRLTEVPLRRRR